MTATAIQQNIAKVSARIESAAASCGRNADEITLLAVSKTRSALEIRTAAAAGLAQIGENYLQEALDKQAQLQDLKLCWHFIGPIQSNKTRPIAEHFDWVHSVDRLKIARRLSEQRPAHLPPLQICLQVNISDEASKSGVALADLAELAAGVASLERIRLRGLMAIPEPSGKVDEQRSAFAALQEALTVLPSSADTLSMGMSADLEAAIAEGSTMVRVGTDIFGPRA